MLGYYFESALHSLARNLIASALMAAAIGVGIGTSMTILTIFRAMSADPIPDKSLQLFVPQIQDRGPEAAPLTPDRLPTQLSYLEAMDLMRASAAHRQAAMYPAAIAVFPSDTALSPFQASVRATYSDFFPMFEAPFRYGGPWGHAEDEAHAAVIVISQALNDRLFGDRDSVGRTVRLGATDYRVVGVLSAWQPVPRFYDLSANRFGLTEQVFMPLTTALDRRLGSTGSYYCYGSGVGPNGLRQSDCDWVQFWVELPTAASVLKYRTFLHNYALEQLHAGNFHWQPRVALRNVRQWLRYQGVVIGTVRILSWVSFGFLAICLVNAMALMLARSASRAAEVGVRRALGADRRAILGTCLIEAGAVGLLGAVVGLCLTALGLRACRELLSRALLSLTYLHGMDIALTAAMAVATTLVAALYPVWLTTRTQPAWHLKVE